MRAFVALRLSRDSEDAIAALIDQLQRLTGNISWSRRDNLHLTLRFLGGAVPSEMVRTFAPALARIAATFNPFDLHAHGIGAFPHLRRPRVIWTGITALPLLNLAQQIEAAAQGCEFAPEPRPYSPHLTIGRVRDLRGWEAVRQRIESSSGGDFGVSRIAAISLYRSHLGRSGATYEELGRYALAGASNPAEPK